LTICSLVIQTKPQHLSSVNASLNAMQGVEIHAQGENGKMVVTVDHPSREYCGDIMTKMSQISGVMSSSLVFEYQEDLDADQTPKEHAPITLSQPQSS